MRMNRVAFKRNVSTDHIAKPCMRLSGEAISGARNPR
jgi:hypothetical protein